MTKRDIFIFLFILFLITACPRNAPGPEALRIKKDLPLEFTGSFQWHGETLIQEVSMRFSDVEIDGNGEVIATGTGEYNTINGVTRIGVKMVVKPSTLDIRIWEMDPSGNAGFITNGSHIGTISQDLKEIEATWTTDNTKQQGQLYLKAGVLLY